MILLVVRDSVFLVAENDTELNVMLLALLYTYILLMLRHTRNIFVQYSFLTHLECR